MEKEWIVKMKSSDVILVKGDATEEKAKSTLFVILVIIGAVAAIAGIAYAVEQIVDLISSDVKGIHLYSMNNAYVAKSINNSIESIIKSVNK